MIESIDLRCPLAAKSSPWNLLHQRGQAVPIRSLNQNRIFHASFGSALQRYGLTPCSAPSVLPRPTLPSAICTLYSILHSVLCCGIYLSIFARELRSDKNVTMSENDDEFMQKVDAGINQVGPYCSCLVTAILIILGFLWLVGR